MSRNTETRDRLLESYSVLKTCYTQIQETVAHHQFKDAEIEKLTGEAMTCLFKARNLCKEKIRKFDAENPLDKTTATRTVCDSLIERLDCGDRVFYRPEVDEIESIMILAKDLPDPSAVLERVKELLDAGEVVSEEDEARLRGLLDTQLPEEA